MGWQHRKQYELNRLLGIPNHPPCANCGKTDGGYMSATYWGHDYKCCSEKCGRRLGQRIENGMYPPVRPNLDYEGHINRLRFRIKHLEKQLRLHGHKISKTPYRA